MRLSAVLVAVFTASATFGLSNSASGQTSYSESAEETLAGVTPAPSIELPDRPIPDLTQNPPQSRKAGKTSKGEALKMAEAPARGEGENDRKPPNRFTDTPSPVSPSLLQLKPELASNSSPASSSPTAPPQAQQASPLPPSEATVTPAWIAAELGKPDESGAIAQNAQVTPRPAPTAPPANSVPPPPPGPAPRPSPPAPAGTAGSHRPPIAPWPTTAAQTNPRTRRACRTPSASCRSYRYRGDCRLGTRDLRSHHDPAGTHDQPQPTATRHQRHFCHGLFQKRAGSTGRHPVGRPGDFYCAAKSGAAGSDNHRPASAAPKRN